MERPGMVLMEVPFKQAGRRRTGRQNRAGQRLEGLFGMIKRLLVKRHPATFNNNIIQPDETLYTTFINRREWSWARK
jgi:hypothetical protein